MMRVKNFPLSNLLRALAIISLLALGMGNRGCSEADKRTAIRNTAIGIRVIAEAIPIGVERMRTLREEGETTPEFNLKLAKIGLDATNATLASVDLILANRRLEGEGVRSLSDRLNSVVDFASRLESEGTLHIKNGRRRILFNLGIAAGKSGLVVALQDLKSNEGLVIDVDEETAKILQGARPKLEDDVRLLKEAIRRLEGN